MKDLFKKELHVALHAQTAKFRVGKYLVIFAILGAVYYRWGWEVTWKTLLGMFICALVLHFFYRWKTNGWENSWGGYQSLFK